MKMEKSFAQIRGEIGYYSRHGNEEVNNGHTEEAVQWYEKAYKKSRELEDDQTERACAFNFGAALISHGQLSDGLELLHKAKPPDGQRDGRSNGELFYNMAYAYARFSENGGAGSEDSHKRALDYYNQAYEEFRAERDSDMEMECLWRLSELHERRRNHAASADVLEKLTKVSAGNKVKQATLLYDKANHLRQAQKTTEALKAADDCLEVMKPAEGDSSTTEDGRVYNDIGLVYTQLCAYDKAVQCFELALPLVRSGDNRQLEAVVLQNLGAAYNFVGDYQRSIKFHEDAATTYAEMKNRSSQGQCYANLAYAHFQLGDLDSAEEAFLHANLAAKDTKDTHSIWQVLEGLGAVKFNQRNLRKAQYYFQKAHSYVGPNNQEVSERIMGKLTQVIQIQQQQRHGQPHSYGAMQGQNPVLETRASQGTMLHKSAPFEPVMEAREEPVEEAEAGTKSEGKRILRVRKRDSFGIHHPKMARGFSASYTSDSPRFRQMAELIKEEQTSSSSSSDSSGDSDSDSSTTETEGDVPDKGVMSPAVQEIFRPTSSQRPSSRQLTLRRDDKPIKAYEQMLLEQEEEEDKKKDGSGTSDSDSDSDSGSEEGSSSESSEEDDEEDEIQEKNKRSQGAAPPLPTQSPPHTSEMRTYEPVPHRASEHSQNIGSSSRGQGQSQGEGQPGGDRVQYTTVDFASKTRNQEPTMRGNDPNSREFSQQDKGVKNASPQQGANFFKDEDSVSEDETEPSTQAKAPGESHGAQSSRPAESSLVKGGTGESDHYQRIDSLVRPDDSGTDSEAKEGIDNLSRGQRDEKLYREHMRMQNRSPTQDDAPLLPSRGEKKKSKACVIM